MKKKHTTFFVIASIVLIIVVLSRSASAMLPKTKSHNVVSKKFKECKTCISLHLKSLLDCLTSMSLDEFDPEAFSDENSPPLCEWSCELVHDCCCLVGTSICLGCCLCCCPEESPEKQQQDDGTITLTVKTKKHE